jgi:hypothetical protein
MSGWARGLGWDWAWVGGWWEESRAGVMLMVMPMAMAMAMAMPMALVVPTRAWSELGREAMVTGRGMRGERSESPVSPVRAGLLGWSKAAA